VKNEHTECKNDYDKECQKTLNALQTQYGVIRLGELMRMNGKRPVSTAYRGL